MTIGTLVQLKEIRWPIDFAQNVNVQCQAEREALSYQDGWAGSTYFQLYFLQDKCSSGTKRTVGIEQFQKAEFVSFELTRTYRRVLKCFFFFFFFFLYLKIQSVNIVFILIA